MVPMLTHSQLDHGWIHKMSAHTAQAVWKLTINSPQLRR